MPVELPSLIGNSFGLGLQLFLGLLTLGVMASPLWFFRKRKQSDIPIDELLKLNPMRVSYHSQEKKEGEAARLGYLRSLTQDRATLVVADRSLRKGSQLTLDLGSYGQDSHSAGPIKGRVIQTKSLGGSPENILINIQFLETKSDLRSSVSPH